MNIINKSGIDRDPFAASDRGGFGKNAGKGDSNRSMTRAFRDRFPKSMSGRVIGTFRKVYK